MDDEATPDTPTDPDLPARGSRRRYLPPLLAVGVVIALLAAGFALRMAWSTERIGAVPDAAQSSDVPDAPPSDGSDLNATAGQPSPDGSGWQSLLRLCVMCGVDQLDKGGSNGDDPGQSTTITVSTPDNWAIYFVWDCTHLDSAPGGSQRGMTITVDRNPYGDPEVADTGRGVRQSNDFPGEHTIVFHSACAYAFIIATPLS